MFRCNSHKTNCTHYGPNVRGELSRDKILADAGENSTKTYYRFIRELQPEICTGKKVNFQHLPEVLLSL